MLPVFSKANAFQHNLPSSPTVTNAPLPPLTSFPPSQQEIEIKPQFPSGAAVPFDTFIDDDVDAEFVRSGPEVDEGMPQWAKMIKKESQTILNMYVPLLWTLLFVIFMDRDSFFRCSPMPFLGLFAAVLCNSVPLGGGVVYVPLLLLFGFQLKLGVSFTVATMTFGNGVFGFLRWLNKDSQLVLWETFPYTVIPSSLGSIIGMIYLPPAPVVLVKWGFALFCCLLSYFVYMAAQKGGVENMEFVRIQEHAWLKLSVVSLLAGLILVPNIGFGPALTTFIMLAMMGGKYTTKQAVVTGIVTGGWVSVIPFIIRLTYFKDVPFHLWIMVLPGVFMGARLAPIAHDHFGIEKILFGFSVFLVGSALVMVTH